MSQVHTQARTTPRTRAEIKASPASLVDLAERYNITRATAAKWKGRETPHDLSHRPQAQHQALASSSTKALTAALSVTSTARAITAWALAARAARRAGDDDALAAEIDVHGGSEGRGRCRNGMDSLDTNMFCVHLLVSRLSKRRHGAPGNKKPRLAGLDVISWGCSGRSRGGAMAERAGFEPAGGC